MSGGNKAAGARKEICWVDYYEVVVSLVLVLVNCEGEGRIRRHFAGSMGDLVFCTGSGDNSEESRPASIGFWSWGIFPAFFQLVNQLT